MVNLIASLKQYATSKDPDFKVWVNGAEELLDHPDYVKAIDGMVKEEVYYSDDGKKQPASETQYTLENLHKAVDAGKPVVVIEYVDGATKIADVHQQAARDGLGSYIADLELNGVNLDGVLPGQTVHPVGTGGSTTPPVDTTPPPVDPPTTGTGSGGSGGSSAGGTGGSTGGTGGSSGGTGGTGGSTGGTGGGTTNPPDTNTGGSNHDWQHTTKHDWWQSSHNWGHSDHSTPTAPVNSQPSFDWHSTTKHDWFANFWHH